MTRAQDADVWEELIQIRRKLETLEDVILSPTDRQALKEARKEFREGKTVSHEKVTRTLL